MRGTATGFQVETIVRAILDELPGLDKARLQAAVERGVANAARQRLDTAAAEVVDRQLARVEATEESTEKAQILRELADTLEHDRGDAERAIVLRLAAFAEAPLASDLDPLLRLAGATDRWNELPLDQMLALLDSSEDAGPRRLRELATIVQRRGDAYRAADCYERVLVLDPSDLHAHESLELFYRSTGEWGQLIDLLDRRAVHVEDPERAELFREMGVIYERELGDDVGALEAYRRADELEVDHVDVLEALARLYSRIGGSDDDAYAVLERLAPKVAEPKRRANLLVRAANVCQSFDRAQELFERALADDPDLVAAVDGLALLLRDRNKLAELVALLHDAAARPAFASERSRWLAEAADFCLATGDIERAKALYRDARAADPANHKAGLALVELGFDTGSLVELVPILDELCASTSEPGRLRGYVLQRGKVAKELGDTATMGAMLSRAVELDPHDPATRRELADVLFEQQREWLRVRELYEGLLDDHEDLFHADVSIELHYRVARAAHELGDEEGAAKHAAVTLALAPQHLPALLLRKELDTSDPEALLADDLALANLAPVEERGVRFESLGDRYALLGDRATSREMFREALAYRPSDHLLLTKFLGLVADEGDWTYSLDLVQRLIDTEKDPKVRARYRHLAAMIARDELALRDRAAQLFGEALDDDPTLFTAADELEAMLAGEPLVAFYSRRLGQLKADEGRRGEALRLWDRLGKLCVELGRYNDAVAAAQVGLQLDPDGAGRKQALADLYLMGDAKHDAAAIALHNELLRTNKRRASSYQALRMLHRRSHHPQAARACDDALAVLGVAAAARDKIEALFGNEPTGERRLPGAAKPMTNEDFLGLARLDVDLQLSSLFGVLAPAFAAERARTRPVPAAPKAAELPAPVARVLARVVASFGIARPLAVIDKDQVLACQIAMRAHKEVFVPVVSLGRAVLDADADDQELAFALARRLADLRSERIARLLTPRPAELVQMLELTSNGDRARGQWLSATLTAADIEQAYAIGARYRGADHGRLANDWLASTERAADRIGLVVIGDLATCVRVIDREAGADAASRTLELAWASVTDEVLAVRARIEGWR